MNHLINQMTTNIATTPPERERERERENSLQAVTRRLFAIIKENTKS